MTTTFPYNSACYFALDQIATEWLKNFDDHLREACLGQVSEIFDGDPPHTPRGCVAQAWSVAELLRFIFKDVYEKKESTQAAPSALY